jgi:AcrR family transcriptional regulator
MRERSRRHPAKTPKSERTRSHILETARRLFNERGTAPVSTNLIAAEAEISPGNLYYHFADKREIIRALQAQIVERQDELLQPDADAARSLAKLQQLLTVVLAVAWDYRFFERELVALLRADPHLRAVFADAYDRRLREWMELAEQLVAQGELREPRPPRSLNDLGVAIWLIATSWLAFLDVTGDPHDPDQVARVGDLIRVVLDPYLTARGRRKLDVSPGRGG